MRTLQNFVILALMLMALVNCQREEVAVNSTGKAVNQDLERVDLASTGITYSRVLAKLLNFSEFRSIVEEYYLEREANDASFNYVVKLFELRDYYDSNNGRGSFLHYLESVLTTDEYEFVARTIDGSDGIYPGIFIPYYHDSIGGSGWNINSSGEVLLNYDSRIGEIRGFSYSGDEVSYGLTNLKDELLSKGRVIFSFVDGFGNDIGGYTVEERKFWGWECQDTGNYVSDGCIHIQRSCTYYVFWIGVRHKDVDATINC